MKTKVEIIQETGEYYNLSNRGYNYSDDVMDCVYLSPEGNRCAVGRCILDDRVEELQKTSSGLPTTSVYHLFGSENMVERIGDLDSYLKEEYRGHSIEFWHDLQTFHDFEPYWGEDGITDYGKKRMEELISDWKDR